MSNFEILLDDYFDAELFVPGGEGFQKKRPRLLAGAKRFLADYKGKIKQAHTEGAGGRETVERFTRLHDILMDALFRIASFDTEASEGECVLMALGGYGRGELNPCSDIDVMFFYHEHGRPYAEEVAERMLYLFWDLSLDVGNCARTEGDCLEQADRDLTVRTAMIDARFLSGSEPLFDHFRKAVHSQILGANTNRFVREKMQERTERLHKYGSSVYLLEPNLKEGEGGLRDLHTALWLCKVKFKANSLRELVQKGVFTEETVVEYDECLDYLWRVRNELHFISGRKNDQLHFDQQEKLALFLGYVDTRRSLAVEQFMQDFYYHAVKVEHLASGMINAVLRQDEAPLGIIGFLKRRSLGNGFSILRGEISFNDPDLFTEDPANIMRAFELLQHHDARLSIDLKTLIRENLHLINDRARRSRGMTEPFLNILRYRKRVGRTLREMHHLRVLNHFIPEFEKIFCKVQYDLYHIYTVDIHSLFAIEEIERLWDGTYRDERPVLTRVANDIDRPELLLLGVLFHDIGKGAGHDHCNRGGDMIPTIARRLGLSREDSLRLEFLVRNHLLMPHLSQRRDLHDDRLIADFAAKMEMSENLNMLYLLSFADIRSVGPQVWTEWKGGLLRELYEKTHSFLERGNFQLEERSQKVRNRRRKVAQLLAGEFPEKEIRDSLKGMNTRYILSHRSAEIAEHFRVLLSRGNDTLSFTVTHNTEYEYSQIIISTLDFAGLFSKVTGVMTANGINILGAQVYTSGTGVALDILQVRGPGDALILDQTRWDKIRSDLIDMIQGRMRIDELVSRRRAGVSKLYERHRPKSATRIEADNEISREYTVIDIYTSDKPGVLYDITKTFKELGIYIGVSKISTKVDQVSDTFYIQDIFGQKLKGDKLEELRQALFAVLDRKEE